MKILGICGSLRKDSYNLKLLKSFGEILAEPEHFSIATLHDIALFNEDQEALAIPKAVSNLAERIHAADALIIGCPEYNYSIPGVLKNAIDWISRHPLKPFAGKKAAIIGASPGRLGTARAQYHLRQVAVFLDLRIINRPEIMVGEAHNKFGPDGRLNDPVTVEMLKKVALSLAE
jgi:chromate reductase